MHYLLAVVAALVGAGLGGAFGFVFGGLLGYGAVLLWRQGEDLDQLKRQVASLVVRLSAEPPGAPEQPPPEPVSAPVPRPTSEPELEAPRPTPTPSPAASPAASGSEASSETPRHASPAIHQASQIDKLINESIDRIRTFFTTGNVVVRIGVIVLFFGIVFLLNYAYEHSLIPVELRLAGAGLSGIVLTVFGWRLRGRSDTYGLVLQGAGVGILYLTIYASARFL
ncbi:MAG: DUF2339 domain-containing protein, partial [Gammaproteobacteria bacterium]|nr:DUF2339 domain-containing protein [Gammaproteobacteria bacterium]